MAWTIFQLAAIVLVGLGGLLSAALSLLGLIQFVGEIVEVLTRSRLDVSSDDDQGSQLNWPADGRKIAFLLVSKLCIVCLLAYLSVRAGSSVYDFVHRN